MSAHQTLAAMVAYAAIWMLNAAAVAPVTDAARLDGGEIHVDGRLGEAAWRSAAPSSGFLQRNPHDGEPAQLETEFRVLYDDDAVFVGIRAFDPEPAEVRGLLTRRDEHSPSDWLWVSLDTYRDRRTAFTFALNPRGVQRDWAIYDDSATPDDSWDAVWQGAAAVDSGGWSAEFRIPLSQLRYAHDNGSIWGLQVGRLVQRTREESYWAPWPKGSSGSVSLYGDLEKIGPLAQKSHLELTPYVVVGGNLEAGGSARPRALSGAGLDVRYGLTSNFTLSATLNPDFGQIEADPSTVNLTASETFFAEKRDFFLEGRDIFQQPLGDGDENVEQLFYSRRIGAPPREEPIDEDARVPRETTIYTAAKVSGKTTGGWSAGALHAVTAEESVPVAAGSRERQVLEPLTNYSVLSLRKDLRQGRTNVGLLLTGVHRRLDGTGLDWLHDRAYSGGLRAQHKFSDDLWFAELRLLGSQVHGSTEAIAETQQASQRYWQRPDASHVTFDPERRSLSGYCLQTMIARTGGTSVRGAIGAEARSPGFEVNDIGFQQSADFVVSGAWLQLRDEEPGSLLRAAYLNFNGWAVANYGRRLVGASGNVNAHTTLLNYWDAGAGIGYDRNQWETGALRGGAALRGEPSWSGWAWLGSDSREMIHGNLDTHYRRRDGGRGYQASVSATLTLQARSNLELSAGPFVSRNLDPIQYVDTPEDAGGTPHYVLARIDQTTLGLTLRGSYTFSPTLSLQVYAQPFVSSGAYDRYREVVAPSAERWRDRFSPLGGRSVVSDGTVTVDDAWSFDEADFSVRELRSNVVLRWEYLPGSTVFVVWSHARSGDDSDGRFDIGRNLEGLGEADGEHVVMVKLAYWMET